MPERHRFTIKNRKGIAFLLGVSVTALIATLPFLSKAIWIGGALLATSTAVYYAIFRFSKLREPFPIRGPWKELLIALCFAGGIILCCLPVPLTLYMWVIATGLTLLFLSNCLTISKAESEHDRRNDPTGYFSSRNGSSALLPVTLLLVATGCSLYIMQNPNSRLAGLAIFVTTVLCLWINRPGTLPSYLMQAASDLVLLVPPALVLIIHAVLSR